MKTFLVYFYIAVLVLENKQDHIKLILVFCYFMLSSVSEVLSNTSCSHLSISVLCGAFRVLTQIFLAKSKSSILSMLSIFMFASNSSLNDSNCIFE